MLVALLEFIKLTGDAYTHIEVGLEEIFAQLRIMIIYVLVIEAGHNLGVMHANKLQQAVCIFEFMSNVKSLDANLRPQFVTGHLVELLAFFNGAVMNKISDGRAQPSCVVVMLCALLVTVFEVVISLRRCWVH